MSRFVTLAALGLGTGIASSALGVVYTDSAADQSGGGTEVVDITSVEVTNDATNLTLKINLTGDISQVDVSDFGLYHIGFDTTAGGTTTPLVGWGQQFGLSSGMDYWVGSWVNFGGAELHGWDGSAWGATIPGTTVGLAQFSTTITIPLAAMGLSAGSNVTFDVWTTFGSPGGQSAYDGRLSNPANAVAEPWNGVPYDASTAGPGGTPLVSVYTVAAATGVTSEWNVDADGNWSVGTNWLAGVPNGVDHVATFGTIATAARTVTVDAPQTAGALNFSSVSSYTVAGANALTLDVASGSASITVSAGTHTIAAPVTLNDDLVVTSAASSGVALTGPLTATGRAITKAGAGSVQVENVRAASLAVGEGTAKIRAKALANAADGTSVVAALSIATGAQLDLTNNSAVIDYKGAVGTLVADTRTQLADGRLTSSSAQTTHKLGYGDNAVLGKASFGGQTVDSSSLLVKYTYVGDANIDGQVDINDLAALATAWQTAAPWTSGDFDYSGIVDINDLAGLATNWQAGVGAPLAMSFEQALAAVGLGGVSVPEPASVAALGLATLLARVVAVAEREWT